MLIVILSTTTDTITQKKMTSELKWYLKNIYLAYKQKEVEEE